MKNKIKQFCSSIALLIGLLFAVPAPAFEPGDNWTVYPQTNQTAGFTNFIAIDLAAGSAFVVTNLSANAVLYITNTLAASGINQGKGSAWAGMVAREVDLWVMGTATTTANLYRIYGWSTNQVTWEQSSATTNHTAVSTNLDHFKVNIFTSNNVAVRMIATNLPRITIP